MQNLIEVISLSDSRAQLKPHCELQKAFFFQRVVPMERLRTVLERGVTVDGMKWILG
jgi:hypothetical protein